MSSFYAIFDLHKYHSTSSLRMQEAHNERDYEMKHVDESLTYLNREIVSTGGISYAKRWKEILTEREASLGKKIPVRSNAVIAYDIVTAMSPGAEKALGIDIDEWAEENKRFMEDTFGKDNIIAMTLHADEVDVVDPAGRRGIHIHTQIIPIDERGRLCARSFTGSRTMMKHLHTKYAEYMAPFGLERGENNSKLAHSSRKRWYSDVDKICNATAPRIRDGETMEDYLARLDKEWQDIHLKLAKEEEKMGKKVALSETRQAQIFGEYAYAINLQHILEEEYGGDMRLVKERLKEYQILEKAVPRKNLSAMIQKIIEKYPPEQSIAFWRKGKKKKHAKWESIPDVVVTPVDSSTDTKYESFEEGIANELENTHQEQESKKSVSILEGEGKEKYQSRFEKEEDNSLANPFGENLEN